MKCTILGTGDVEGHPIITKPNEFLKKGESKLRPGFLVQNGKDTVIFDAGPDIRQQLLETRVKNISAIFITHQHFDHLWGIADIFQLSWLERITFPVYVTEDTALYIRTFMPWIDLPLRVMQFQKIYEFDNFSVEPFSISHSKSFQSASFLITSHTKKNVFYAPDILKVNDNKMIKCSISVTDGTFFFGKYIANNHEHLGPTELKKLIDSWEAEKNYLISVAPYYYSKTTDELRSLLPARYYLPDDYTHFDL